MNYNALEVTDRESFVNFTKHLFENFQKNGENWQNNNLELFLDALSTYSEEVKGYYNNVHPEKNPEHATWRIFADILSGAVIYE